MNYALIGCGRIATNHVKAVLNNNLKFVAACDIEPDNIESLLAKHDLNNDTSIERYTDYKEMIEAHPELELVAIATSSGAHAEIALYCIDHGINVIIEKLSLDNVVAIHGRAEDIARDQNYREGFDLVVSRAVADMRLLLELCIPFVNEDGFFVSYKGPRFAEELSTASHALEELNVKCVSDVSFDLSGADRSLVFFKRDGLLSDRYPRRAGIPAKRPL